MGSVSPPCRRAWGKVTAWLFFCWRGHRYGRAPWPGPHRGPVGRAAGPHARGARAGPSAGGYGSAALFLISPVSHPSRGADGGRPGPGGPALRGTVRIPAWVGRHPKVPARWNIAVRRAVTRRCYRTGWGAVSGDQAQLPGPRGGLGPVGGSELAQDVGHGHFDCVKRHHQVVGDALVGPAGGRHLRVTPHPGERFSSSTSIASDSKPAVSACRPDHRGCR
jgi:hypothetical protein